MKRFLFILLFCLPYAAVAQPAEVIVRLEPGAVDLRRAMDGGKAVADIDPDLLDGVRRTAPVFARSAAKSDGTLIPAYVLTLRDSTRLSDVVSAWRGRGDVRYVQENVVFSVERTAGTSARMLRPLHAADPDNAFADSLDHLDVIRAREAQQIT